MDTITKGGPSAGGTTNMMHIFQSCNDISDAVELFGPQQLYLKPVARLNVSVQLPQLKQPGKTISNWEVMERLKNMVKPTEFIVLKVSKSTLEFLRFEGEIESKSNLEGVVSRLDGRTIKLSGFSDLLKVRAAEAKVTFPTRHSWDSYFRDAKNMNEMKPGERPDTIHITNLPCKWFSSKHDLAHGSDLPSEYIFRKVFEQFGEVRCVDIPLLDPYRNLMKAQISGMKTFSFGQGLAFEGYVQFQEYVCFVKAMDTLRGMKLLHKEGDKAFTASIKVDFDKTKHLSEASIRRRRQEREHLMANEREIEERERRVKEAQEREAEALRNKEREKQQLKEDRRRQREERRKAKHLKKIKEEETRVMNKKIAVEERKLIIAQRKLESIRLLDELFERVKMKIQKEKSSLSKSQDPPKEDVKLLQEQGENKEDLSLKERELRQRLLKKYKSIQEKLLEEQREKLRRTVEGRTRLESIATKPIEKGGSSSDSSSDKQSPSRRLDKNKERNEERRSNSGDRQYDWYSGMPVSSLSSMDFSAYVHAYGLQPRFTDRFPYRENLYRQRGRWQRYPRGRNIQPLYYEQWNEEYYKYFRKVAKRSESRSMSKSRSRSRSKSRRRTRSRSRRRSRSRSRQKSKSRSRSRSRRRTRSKSRSRSKSKSKQRSRSKSRSKSVRSRLKVDRPRSSRERSRSRARDRSRSLSRNRPRSRTRSGSRGRRRRSHTKTRSSEKRRRSKSDSRSRRRKSTSSRDHRTAKSNRSRSPSPRKRSPRHSTSPRRRSSRSKSRNQSKERKNLKKSLRALSRELSLSLSPDVGKQKLKEKSEKRSVPKEEDKKKSKKNKDSKNCKEKQKSK